MIHSKKLRTWTNFRPISSQVGKSACIVLAKERHSKGERVPFSACFQLVSKLKSEAASTLSLMFQIFLEKNYRTPCFYHGCWIFDKLFDKKDKNLLDISSNISRYIHSTMWKCAECYMCSSSHILFLSWNIILDYICWCCINV